MEGELYDIEQAEREAQAARGASRARSGGYISRADRFDGGGAGQSGASFEGGGLLSDIANMFGRPRRSYGAETGQRRPALRPSLDKINAARDRVNAPYSFGRDLLDGGGLGRRATLAEINSGRGFRGGLLSGLGNMFGVRPMGANDLALITSYDAALAANPQVKAEMGFPDEPKGGLLTGPVAEPSVFDLYVEGLGAAADGTTDAQLMSAYENKATEAGRHTPPLEGAAADLNRHLQDAVGLDKTIEILHSPNAAQVLREFTANGNQLPSQFSDRALNIGVYGDPFGRGTMVNR